MSETLNALTLPLWGSRLIEASAGTGKTWTIAALYLRLVLGHGAEGVRFERPLAPSEILVMTFTRAATRELSDRIRSRLLEAARCFRGEQVPDEGDDLLRELMASYAADETPAVDGSDAVGEDEWSDDELEGEAAAEPGVTSTALAHAAWRLSAAAESMDDAAVHTIDAWCQRMLREHAFDSGNLFDEELMADEKNMIDEAARDYWRQQLYPLKGGALDAALAVWGSVDKLIEDVRRLVAHSEPAHGRPAELGSLVTRLTGERERTLGTLKQGWDRRADEMLDWLEGHYESKSCPFSKTSLGRRHYTGWLKALKDWSVQPELHLPEMKTGLTRFTPQGMGEVMKPGAGVELHPHFDAFDRLMQSLKAIPDMAATIRLHAAACVKDRLDMLKEQAGAFGFADMLDRLDAALHGPNGERLRERMILQYPVALIDEFQDTSALQYRIFDSLYRTASNDPHTAMLLIGDPKQSIYGFRGADIDSYLGARRHTDRRHYVLGTNHRSTVPLVGAVNRLFEQAEARAGRGAFLFRGDGMDASGRPGGGEHDAADPLPFIAVGARGRGEQLVDAHGVVPAMTIVHESRPATSDAGMRQFAALGAEYIVGLLSDERAGYREEGTAFTRLRPADIAVLVRTGAQAKAVRRELRRRGVASVYLSDKDSVFDSDEARDLVHWLKAVASPGDMRLLRSAFATALVGLGVDELARIASDEDAFDARSEQVRDLHQVWLRQGVLTMLRQSLHALALPSRWLAQDDGERRLTNYLHLAELLQAASTQLDGEQALVRWLGDQIDGALEVGDDRIVRLESDADLVKVVTIHKSKGLEYPVVCLPFAGSFRAADGKDRFLRIGDGEGGRRLVFDMKDEAAMAQADDERLQEDVRLLYVALTRARHALWLGVAPLGAGKAGGNSLHRSALGHLLSGGEEIAADHLGACLAAALDIRPAVAGGTLRSFEVEFGAALDETGEEVDDPRVVRAEGCLHDPQAAVSIVVRAAPATIDFTRLGARTELPPLHDAPAYDADFERHWSIGSFSALVRDLPTASVRQSMDEAEREDDLLDEPDPPQRALPARTADAPWHRFPRGAFPGNFLHDQLEWLAGEDFALAPRGDASGARSQTLRDQLLRRCERDGWGHRAEDVLAWLSAVVATPLPPVGVSLDGIANRLSEMEFWFPSDGMAAGRIDALCRKHLLVGRARPALPVRQLRGLLMGFADLVFEHEGRYWVLDYKSNALGPRDADYHVDALEAAVAEHRYDVQAAVYLLALHRLLRARLGDAYDPAQHLGGAVFFFLRGIEGPQRGCCLLPAVPALLESLDEALGSREALA